MVLPACGCDRAPPKAIIRGTVSINGKPLEKGVIVFVPSNGDAITVEIRNGHYEAATIAGKLAVQISAPIVTGRRPEYNGPGAPMVDIIEERLPARFNRETELIFEAQPGENQKDWPLELK